jgi:hypothetical protein
MPSRKSKSMEAVPFYVDLYSSLTLIPPAGSLDAPASVTHYAGVACSPQWPMGLNELYADGGQAGGRPAAPGAAERGHDRGRRNNQSAEPNTTLYRKQSL